MLPSEALDDSADLRDQLAANSIIDPRTVPVRFSALKNIARSPAHYHHAVQQADRWAGTASMRIGSGGHAMLMGQPVVQYTGAVRRGKAWDAFRAANRDATILSGKEWDTAHAISQAVKADPLAARLLLADNMTYERTIHWDYQGRACRSTPDARSAYTLIDLKTTKCADPGRFVRDAMWMGYHAQLAFYGMALEAAGGMKPRDSYIIAVENKPPHPVVVLKLTERAINMGERLVRGWMERLKVCEDANEWPGYVQCVTDFDVPDDDIGLTFGDDDEEDAP